MAEKDNIRDALGEQGACSAIVRSLDNSVSNADVAFRACAAIHTLAVKHAKHQADLGTLGACDAVIKAMQTHESHAEVALYGSMAVASLARQCSDNKGKLGRARVIKLMDTLKAGELANNSLVQAEVINVMNTDIPWLEK